MKSADPELLPLGEYLRRHHLQFYQGALILRQAFAANAPVLIEVLCDEMPSPWECIMLPRAHLSTGSV